MRQPGKVYASDLADTFWEKAPGLYYYRSYSLQKKGKAWVILSPELEADPNFPDSYSSRVLAAKAIDDYKFIHAANQRKL